MRNALTQQLIGVELGMTVGFHEKIKDGVCLSTFLNLRDLVPICLGWQHVEVVDVLPWVCFSGTRQFVGILWCRWFQGIKVALRRKRLAPVCPSSFAAAEFGNFRSMHAQNIHLNERMGCVRTQHELMCNIYILLIYIYILYKFILIICIYTYESCCVCTWCIKYT